MDYWLAKSSISPSIIAMRNHKKLGWGNINELYNKNYYPLDNGVFMVYCERENGDYVEYCCCWVDWMLIIPSGILPYLNFDVFLLLTLNWFVYA